MNLPTYTFPIFLAAIVLITFSALMPTSTTIFLMMFLLPALVLYQAYIILRDGATEEQD